MITQQGAVIWLTGLPCSGKTTLADKLQSNLLENDFLVVVLDGDQIRKTLSPDLGFLEKDRKENIRRIGEISKLLVDSRIITIVSVISPFREDRLKVRNAFEPGQFVEVYVDCPIDECERRDVKNHYKLARRGELPDFTGVSSPYDPPINPEIHLYTHINNPKECIDEIVAYLITNKYFPYEEAKSGEIKNCTGISSP